MCRALKFSVHIADRHVKQKIRQLVNMSMNTFWMVKSMAKKIKHSHTSKNQRKILEILGKYEELTAKDIAEILWARDIRYQTPEYSSVHRSLSSLYGRGLVEKVGGKLKWRKSKKIQ
jgi:DNA-binding MarR family transcriptional regulator